MKTLIFILILVTAIQSSAQVKHIITTDSVDLYVTVKGKGIPCLFIHGGPASGSYWAEKFTGDSLEQNFQMIYLDQRGCARSSSPKNNNYSIERMVLDFEEVRLALGIKEWLIMGHSFAGLMQMEYARLHPEIIRGMIMINCTLYWKESFDEGFCPQACKLLKIKDKKKYTNDSVLFVDHYGPLNNELNCKNLRWKMGYSSYENYTKMNATFNEIPNWNWGSEEFIVYNPGYRVNFKKYCPDLKMPVLFFYGKKDWYIGPKHYKEVNFPKMMLWGSDVGHMPFLENMDDLIKAIRSFRKKYEL